VSHTLIDGYKYRKSWREFHHNTTHIFLSHPKEYELPGGRISATRGKDEEDFSAARVSAARVSQKFDQR
jgi:hypothetical protein